MFKCSWDSPWREDIPSEFQLFGFEDYVHKMSKSTRMTVTMELWTFKSYGLAASAHFYDLIEDYSKQHLSYQSDALNAFAGLTEMIKADCGLDICYGLVSTALTLGMTWRLEEGSTAARSRQGFPSWSWCGWIGPVSYAEARGDSFSAWTTKYGWINWYLYKGCGGFVLVPQKYRQRRQQPESDPTTSTDTIDGGVSFDAAATSVPTDDDIFAHTKSLLSIPPHKNPNPQLVASSIQQLPRYINSRQQVIPHYLELLRKHGREGPTAYPAPPTVVPAAWLGIGPDVILEPHTLYFEPLTTTVYLSTCYTIGRCDGPRPSPCFPLYDVRDNFLGTAEVTDPAALGLGATNGPQHASVADAWARKVAVRVAVLSGPCDSMVLASQYGMLDRLTYYGARGQPPKFYQAMLLGLTEPLSGRLTGGCHLYERAGIGKIFASALEKMDSLEWDGILLQ